MPNEQAQQLDPSDSMPLLGTFCSCACSTYPATDAGLTMSWLVSHDMLEEADAVKRISQTCKCVQCRGM
jgi:hypothetical protein